jgi:prefoldin subunit 5
MSYRDEVHEGEHEAIVDREVFARAQTILDGHGGKKRRRGANPSYLLCGLLKCANCKMSYTPGSTTKKNGKEYRYYRCVTRDKKGKRECSARPLPADAIEEFVVSRIREAAMAGDLAPDITDELEAKLRDRREELKTERKELPAAIAGLSAEAHRLVETLGTANGTAHRLLEERIEELGAQIALREQRLHQVERALNELRKTEIEVSWVTDALAHFDDVWDVLTVENQARLVAAVVNEVVVDDVAGTVSAELVDLTAGDLVGLVEGEEGPRPRRDVAPGREEETRR